MSKINNDLELENQQKVINKKKEYAKIYREKNKEIINEKLRKHYQLNKEKYKDYNDKNFLKIKERKQKNYENIKNDPNKYEERKKQLRESSKKFRVNHPDKFKEHLINYKQKKLLEKYNLPINLNLSDLNNLNCEFCWFKTKDLPSFIKHFNNIEHKTKLIWWEIKKIIANKII